MEKINSDLMFGSRKDNIDEPNKEPPSFASPYVGLHKKNAWEKYLDTASTYSSSSGSASPIMMSASSSGTCSAVSSGPPSPLPSTTSMPQLDLATNTLEAAHQYLSNMTGAVAFDSDNSSAINDTNDITINDIQQQQEFLQQHHQYLQQQQEMLLHQHSQLAAASMAHQQYALASATSHQQQDEISKSLQMYAMFSAYKSGNDFAHLHQAAPPLSAVDAIMQDFNGNGFISDDYSRFQQYQAAMNFANQQQLHQATVGHNSHFHPTSNSSPNRSPNRSFNEMRNNRNLNEMRNNFWNAFPTHHNQHMQQSTTHPAAAAAAANIDYNSSNNAGNSSFNYCSGNRKKRFQGKNDKYSSAKHCVFCENNNEPEAVVKSHAVRDSLGRVLCPKLRTYVCPICGASGDLAHTVKYCPQKPIITMEDAIKAESFRLAKSNFFKQQMKV